MWNANGFGRFVKTAGRESIIGRKKRALWAEMIGSTMPVRPDRRIGDICAGPLETEPFDGVMSWSVFNRHWTDRSETSSANSREEHLTLNAVFSGRSPR